MKKKILKTFTEIVEKRIEVPCYLCGKGKIIMRQGDIIAHFLHPIDWRIRQELEQYLLKKAKIFLDKLKELKESDFTLIKGKSKRRRILYSK